MTNALTYALQDGVAVLTLDDGKANALSTPVIEAFEQALDRALEEATAVVVAGRPERFCAGFDLKVMLQGMDQAAALLQRGASLFMKLYGLPLPVVVACTGHAVAGGALLVLTGDHRVGAAGPYRIGLNEVEIGMPVPVLAMELARDRLVATELHKATLHARIYAPDDAVRAGWLDEVVPAGEVLARARAEAARLGAFARFPYAASKRRLRERTIRHITSSLDQDLAEIVAGR